MADPGEPTEPRARPPLRDLARAMRGAVGSLRAAVEAMASFPAMDGATRARLLGVVGDESERLVDLVHELDGVVRAGEADRPGAAVAGQLLAALAEAGRERGVALELDEASAGEVAGIALAVAAAPLAAVVVATLGELRRAMAIARFTVQARVVDRHFLLDLGWAPEAGDLPRLLDWQGEILDTVPDAAGGPDRPGLRPAVRELAGEAWFNLDRDGRAAHVRVLLPVASTAESHG